MSFVKKIWKDRISQFPNRRTINDGHTVKRVTVGRDEGVVTEEGTPFDATEMNDLENRIFAAIEQGGGGGGSSGTYDYSELFNKPRVNNVELNDNKTTADLHINYDDLENKPDIPENATELPISANDSTDTKEYIDTGLSGKANKSWTSIGTITDGGTGKNVSAYSEILVIVLINGAVKYNSYVFPVSAIGTGGINITVNQRDDYWCVGSLKVNNNILTYNQSLLSTNWASSSVIVYGR